jgi:hypothetical protein
MSLKHDSFKKVRKEKNKWKVETPLDYEEREDTFLKERLLHKEPKTLELIYLKQLDH